MAFVPTPDTARVVIASQAEGQQILLTQHWRKTGGWTGPSLDLLASAVSSWYLANVHVALSVVLGYVSTTATDVSVDGGAQGLDALGAGTSGGAGGDALPNNDAICISLRTALTGRSNRGRNYIGGLPVSCRTDANHVKPTYITTLVTAYEILLAGLVGAKLVVVSKQHNGVKLTTGVAHDVTHVLAVDNVLDSQRRRLPGRGT